MTPAVRSVTIVARGPFLRVWAFTADDRGLIEYERPAAMTDAQAAELLDGVFAALVPAATLAPERQS